MAAQIKNEKPRADNKASRRRRKKRRTEDFSSDSDSSSSSSSDEEAEVQQDDEPVQQQAQVNIDDIDIDSEDESTKGSAPKPLTNETHRNLNKIQLTTTQLSQTTGFGKSLNSITNMGQIEESIQKDKVKLQNAYLGLMAGEFGNDLDELRKKPDFTDKSLVILAKALQSGSGMFDPETLNSILNK
ncbi:uncharacterized protein CANTADRAFT_20458 [Suhomyces tanzawaensis NRRL Y-17324]|uniref:Ribosome assembly protein 3 n=1 Tax=Suhomyces tanzawaensis NRRL Y-17324 TaxID=984487 RepID=A0A1E4SMZ7_9ASCO|nr:uncharacterized protein CANTADRAFT_20458 [Suhomyces tanzawaensis NRRL Y-17324]ODV80904.1 hypothetical protein CANTADRAFT_20458 [Suhomyces tanzawaensis NRRL Y-17324]